MFSSGGVAWLGPSQYEHNSAGGLALTDRGVVVAGLVHGRSAVARFLTTRATWMPLGASPETSFPSRLDIDVHKVIMPKSWRKLIKPGVRVLASCDADCRIHVTVKVSAATARSAGLPTRVVAQGIAPAKGAVPKWIRATAPAKIVDLLLSFGGHGHLHVKVTAEPAVLGQEVVEHWSERLGRGCMILALERPVADVRQQAHQSAGGSCGATRDYCRRPSRGSGSSPSRATQRAAAGRTCSRSTSPARRRRRCGQGGSIDSDHRRVEHRIHHLVRAYRPRPS